MRVNVTIEVENVELEVSVAYYGDGRWGEETISCAGDIAAVLKAFSAGEAWEDYDEFLATVDEQVQGALLELKIRF